MHPCNSGCLCFGQNILLHLQPKVFVILTFLLHTPHLVLVLFFLLAVRVFATNVGLEVLLFSLALFLAVADEFDLLDLVPDDLVLRNGH